MNTVEDDFCFLTLYSLKQMCGISGSFILDQRVILANEQLNTVEDDFCLLTLYSPKKMCAFPGSFILDQRVILANEHGAG